MYNVEAWHEKNLTYGTRDVIYSNFFILYKAREAFYNVR